ncbi:tRNA (adenosine(37)-N6)-threonylcarbamoyltransferase complex transferase subunit TsaD [Xiamenia xianingshaonis]|uniref:tRNA N6-adenosine threonylcarbamoyltransferase n=1 Tax=Xiamenia xianingshaonis TaxID=2682776 RepID=A0A9E6MQK8_9ACTN|nr:tRNA (adenosine(37)-N6)-threonylcarbamoyltransferase complex transferase subunit TsaD [Xiamenia xianingshaonis]NHM14615.1 tRNA (adenosine(37)-N6)-threonylcarbamoyltransferase complex transferase subunit TsaD [Xiamenia xianingshaonis]QTU84345.1 tRNA (adenosine(37)-N6)-threonylcarbamoyltransferase complex transferase subunit TsaD [Xiamenia xianingshaonis]
MSSPTSTPAYVLAFDTANEVVAIGVGVLRPSDRAIETAASVEVAARRASNTTLLPTIDKTLRDLGISRESIACVAVGRGPGSFTGVRIAMATAKGVASALGVGLVGVSSLDAVAWGVWDAGMRGPLAVVADAMRKEVYPVRYAVSEAGPQRLEADRVVKAQAAAAELSGEEGSRLETMLAGDGLCKYADLFAPCGQALDQAVWTPTGRGLLLALQALWRAGDADPFDAARHNPAFALPVYTRLSDAEENERVRLAKNDPKNLVTGVQDVAAAEEAAGLRRDRRTTMNDTAILNARADAAGLTYKPLDAAHAADVAALESQVMGSDAWNEALVADELPRPDRTWWAAYAEAEAEADGGRAEAEAEAPGAAESGSAAAPTSAGAPAGRELLAGYAGGWVVDGQVQILKVGVDPAFRRRGIARELLSRVAADGRDLGASTCSLEVRAGNAGARAFYESLGMHALGTRPRYYSDGEDALIMEGPLPVASRDVAGMALDVNGARATQVLPHDQQLSSESGAGDPGLASHRPLILAIESSCDETAAAIVDGSGELAADVVASQIDFHARFGGVVPEIASRKHIEAVCGVCDECFDRAAQALSIPRLTWHDLDAVAVTYAPGLVGALVVGVAFAKGAAWAADKPFIGVHHLEGHLYANKIGAPDFAPPAVVSLVSGGNTLLVHMKDWGDYETLGATIDDAVGEAFDKVAKALGLGYPGGPAISREAARGDASAIPFPRAMMHSGDLRFSLSGLKTAVVTHINNERAAGHELNVPDICASFQQAVVDVQVKKAETALRQTGARTFCLGGGVAANPVLRAAYEKLCGRLGVRLIMPPLSACGDNAGMIALVALDRFADQRFYDLDADAHAHADLDEPY